MKKINTILGGCALASTIAIQLNAEDVGWSVTPKAADHSDPHSIVEMRRNANVETETLTSPSLQPLLSIGKLPTMEDASRKKGQAKTPRIKAISSDANLPKFEGNVLWSDEWPAMGKYDYNVSRFSVSDDGVTGEILSSNPRYTGNGGALFSDGKLYIVYFQLIGVEYRAYLTKFETDNWTNLYGAQEYEEIGVEFISVSGVCEDPTSGNVYGYFYDKNLSSVEFGIAFYDESYRFPIARHSGPTPSTFAINSKGEAYAVSNKGDFYSIDKETGVMTLVGETGIVPGGYLQSMAFDLTTDRLFWNYVDDETCSSLYEIDTTTGKASFIADFPNNEILVGMNFLTKEANDGAPSAISDISLDFKNGSTSGTLGFDIPVTTFAGTELSGEIDYTVMANEKNVASGSASAGSVVNVAVDLEEGDNKIEVVLENAEGKSPRFFINRWIGYDYPIAISEISLTIDDASSKASLSWTPVNEGLHDGYIDTDNIEYLITDDVTNETVGTAVGTSSFDITLPECAYRAFAYKITPRNGHFDGEATISNIAYHGNPYPIPYECGFESFYDFASFITYDFNLENDERTWAYSSYNQAACALTSINGNSDDWLLTPEINLKSDRQYVLSVEARAYMNNASETFEAAFGQGVDPKTFDIILEPTLVESPELSIYRTKFFAASDGAYRIGLHNIGDPYKYMLIVNNISVTEGSMLSAPDIVENLTLTAGKAGATSATISFTSPNRSIGGDALREISKIEIFRGDTDLIECLTDVEPGKEYSIVDKNCQANQNVTYSIVAYNENGAGNEVSATVFVGYDTPIIPSNVRVIDNFDNTVTINWDNVLEGANGGYIAPEKVYYELYRYVPPAFYFEPGTLELVQTNIKDNKVDVELENNDGAQKRVRYALRAVSEGGASDVTDLINIICGLPDKIPYYESFPNGKYENSYWYGTGFIYVKNVDWAPGSDGCLAYWYPQKVNDSSTLSTGKISFAGSSNPTLYFEHWVDDPTLDFNLDVRVRLSDDQEETIGSYTYSSIAEANDWIKSKIDLSKYKNEPYVYVIFYATGSGVYHIHCIDNVKIYDIEEGNLASTLDSPASMIPGSATKFNVKVYNCSESACGPSIVRLYADGELVDETEILSIPALERQNVQLRYRRINSAPEYAAVYSEVVYASDLKPEDNTSDTKSVYVEQPLTPTASDLTGVRTDVGVELSWTKPDFSPIDVVEDFETYTPWTINPQGEWRFVDGDGKETVAPYTPEFYGMLRPMAFIVFNLHDTKYDPEGFPLFEAHSGQQMLATFATQNRTQSDDWLISPPLDGRKQTISFFARCLSTEAPEVIEVMYSERYYSTDNFTAIKELTIATEDWTKIEFDLPEGAAYFAIHVKSTEGYMLQIDDIAFSTGDYTIKGYNIYRDGDLINTVNADTTSYTDTAISENGKTCDYTVTTVYTVGESAPSNHVMIDMTVGVSTILVEELKDIDIEVFNLTGIKISSGINVLDNLPAGLYLTRRLDTGKTAKVINR